MGGNGNETYSCHRIKNIVENCYRMDVNWLTRQGLFDTTGSESGSITWPSSCRGESSSIGYEVNIVERSMWLYYNFPKSDEKIYYRISLTTTRLPWGGHRWWFACPLLSDGVKCDCRVGKLYLPPGGKYFGCRHCYNLTYESCQESHRYDRIFNMSPAEIRDVGFDPREVLADQRFEERIYRQVASNEQRRRRRKALNWS